MESAQSVRPCAWAMPLIFEGDSHFQFFPFVCMKGKI